MRVKVAEPLPDHVEVEAVEVERVTLCPKNARILQHYFHTRVVRKHHHFRAVGHSRVVWRRARVVERHQGGAREVRGVYAVGFVGEEVCLKECSCGAGEGDIVDRGCKHRAIRPLTCLIPGAGVAAEAHREEELSLHRLRHVGRKLRACKAAELAAEVGHGRGGVDWREAWDLEGGVEGCFVREFVLKNGGHGGVVEGALAC